MRADAFASLVASRSISGHDAVAAAHRPDLVQSPPEQRQVSRQMKEEHMAWKTPKIVEISCAMEVTRYAPADGDDPIQF